MKPCIFETKAIDHRDTLGMSSLFGEAPEGDVPETAGCRRYKVNCNILPSLGRFQRFDSLTNKHNVAIKLIETLDIVSLTTGQSLSSPAPSSL